MADTNDEDIKSLVSSLSKDSLSPDESALVDSIKKDYGIQDGPGTAAKIASAFEEGFMGNNLSYGGSMGEKVAHFAGSAVLPTMGAIAGAPGGPVGSAAGAAAGRAVQVGAAQLIGAMDKAFYPQSKGAPQKSDMAQVLDVAGTAAAQLTGDRLLGQGIGQNEISPIAKMYDGGKGLMARWLSKSTGVAEKDILSAMDNPKEVFGRTMEEASSIYKKGITTNKQEMLPGFASGEEQAQPLKYFLHDISEKTGEPILTKADEISAATGAAKDAVKAIQNGNRVFLSGGETRTLTPQEAFNGVQGINYLKYNAEGRLGIMAAKSRDEAYDKLVSYLEDNGYTGIRNSLQSYRNGLVGKKLGTWLPRSVDGSVDIEKLSLMLGLAAGGVKGVGMGGLGEFAGLAGIMAAATFSPAAVGSAIKVGSPVVGAMAKAAGEAGKATIPVVSREAAIGLNDLFKKK